MAKQTLAMKVDVSDAALDLDDVRHRATDPSEPFLRIHREMETRIEGLFHKLRKGGRFRGITWRYFAPQYVRKDGTVVPAWGGIPKVRGKGMVKGRKRPSGARVKQGDAIMQDTSALRRGVLAARRISKRGLFMGPQQQYAAELSEHHPFALFHLPGDLKMMTGKFRQYFTERPRRRRRG